MQYYGVDPDRAQRILTRLKELDLTILLVSHEEAVLAQADRIIHFDGPPLQSL